MCWRSCGYAIAPRQQRSQPAADPRPDVGRRGVQDAGDAVGRVPERAGEHDRIPVAGLHAGVLGHAHGGQPRAERRIAARDEHAARDLRGLVLIATHGPSGREHLVQHASGRYGASAGVPSPKGMIAILASDFVAASVA
jgi:hypothetical protein